MNCYSELTKEEIKLLKSVKVYSNPDKNIELARRVVANVSTKGLATWQLGICPVIEAVKGKGSL